MEEASTNGTGTGSMETPPTDMSSSVPSAVGQSPARPVVNANANAYAAAESSNIENSSFDRNGNSRPRMRKPRIFSRAADGGGNYGHSQNNLYIHGLPASTTDESLNTLCAPFGEVVSAKAIADRAAGGCRGFGFVLYKSPEAATNAIKKLGEKGIQATYARITARTSLIGGKIEQDPTNLYFQNLPLDFDEAKLSEMLEPFGTIVSCRILKDFASKTSRGVGFARMEDHATCENILKEFHGKEIAGSDGPILCKFADNPTHRNGKGTGRLDRQHGQWIGSMGMPGAFGAGSQYGIDAMMGMGQQGFMPMQHGGIYSQYASGFGQQFGQQTDLTPRVAGRGQMLYNPQMVDRVMFNPQHGSPMFMGGAQMPPGQFPSMLPPTAPMQMPTSPHLMGGSPLLPGSMPPVSSSHHQDDGFFGIQHLGNVPQNSASKEDSEGAQQEFQMSAPPGQVDPRAFQAYGRYAAAVAPQPSTSQNTESEAQEQPPPKVDKRVWGKT